MTKRDFQLALIRGYLQTPETQTDFLLAEAEKFKVNPMNFYMGLLKAYKDFEQYLNSSDGRAWNKNDKGERIYIKNSLNLSDFTNGEFSGNILSSNLPGIKKIVYKFVVTVLEKVEQEDSKQIKGFQTSLSDEQIKNLFEQMQGDYIDTDKENFRAMLTGKECYIISWKHKNPKGGVNQTSLVAFIETILKQTKKVAKTHFGIEVKSINRDANYKHYVTKYKTIIE